MADLRSYGADEQPLVDLADVCDLNEILIVRSVNEQRAQDAAR